MSDEILEKKESFSQTNLKQHGMVDLSEGSRKTWDERMVLIRISFLLPCILANSQVFWQFFYSRLCLMSFQIKLQYSDYCESKQNFDLGRNSFVKLSLYCNFYVLSNTWTPCKHDHFQLLETTNHLKKCDY